MRRAQGFSLVEMIVAMGLTVAVIATVLAMVHPAHGVFDVGLETADLQQRVRVAVDALTRDLTIAGAGPDLGAQTGPLLNAFAPVLPFRKSMAAEDPPGTFRTDVITLVSVPPTAAQTTLAGDLTGSELTVQATPQTQCSPGTNLCGFAPGMTVIIYDSVGSAEALTIAAVADAAAQLTVTARPAGSADTIYRRGANVVEANVHTYYVKTDAAAQVFQLMHADGSLNPDVPVVDHVVGLTFEYYGDPRPPGLTASGEPSYGPRPPDSATTTSGYPPGENCVFQLDAATGVSVPRLVSLAGGTGVVALTAAQLTDGPWCPDEAHGDRWDADLLRIRKVGITIRLAAALAALRGPAGALFSNAGSSRGVNRWAPDQEIRFQVSPRNLNLDRE